MAEEKQEEAKKELNYSPSEKQSAVSNRVWMRFDRMREERDKPRREFDARTITQYVNDNTDAYNGVVADEIKQTKERWQSLIFDQKTRGKLRTLCAMVVNARPYMSLIGETQADHDFALDMAETYDYTWRQENGTYKLFLQTLSAAVKGTVIVEENYTEEMQTIKEITSVDHETGQIKFKEKRVIKGGVGKCTSRIVPLLQFYGNENSPEIEHDCAVVSFPSIDTFKKKYGKFKNAEFVVPGITVDTIEGMKYKSIAENRENIVEVIKYYNEDDDEFIILANGIWINPQDEDEVCPLPYDHHRLPFAKTVYEIADEECFYGKAFPDLMAGEQDTINAILRLIIDQEILNIHKPIILGMGIELESYSLFPGKMVSANGDITQVREMPMSGASPSAFNLLQFLETRADVNTSIDANAQGVHSGKKTAREAMILDENANRIAGAFKVFIYKLLRERAELRISNIKQFYRTPTHWEVLKDRYGAVVTDGDERPVRRKAYRQIPIVNQGKQPRWMEMNPEMCRCNWSIRFEEDFEVPQSKSQRIDMSRLLLDEAKVNPLINADACTIDYLEAIGKPPDKYYIKPTPQELQFQEQEQGGMNNTINQAANLPQNAGMPVRKPTK